MCYNNPNVFTRYNFQESKCLTLSLVYKYSLFTPANQRCEKPRHLLVNPSNASSRSSSGTPGGAHGSSETALLTADRKTTSKVLITGITQWKTNK